MKLTINKLHEITGKDRRTIKKRLVDLPSTSEGYDSVEALPLIYQLNAGERLDIQQELASLNQARRKKLEIETAKLEGNLIDADEVIRHWMDMITNAKTKLLALPQALAHQVLVVDSYGEAEALLKKSIYEALHELSQDGIPTVAQKWKLRKR